MKTKQERSEIFKLFQTGIKKKSAFEEGKQSLLALRAEFASMYDFIFSVCNNEDFCKMPLSKEKTLAYYLYHTLRIEDIIANSLIDNKPQIFFSQGYDILLKSPIITTGNELVRDGLIDFSKKLDIGQLKNYVAAVMSNTNEIIQNMTFEESKTKISAEKKATLVESNVVSTNPGAFWLVDYWCGKTYAGLLLMPLSRHHMMHLDVGRLRVINKIVMR